MKTKIPELLTFGEWARIAVLPREAARAAVVVDWLRQGKTLEEKYWHELDKFIALFEEQFQLGSFSAFEKCLRLYIPGRWSMVCEAASESKLLRKTEPESAYCWLTDRLADLKSVRMADKATLERTRDFLLALSSGVSRALSQERYSPWRFAA